MARQDDELEKEQCRIFKLHQNPDRTGYDANVFINFTEYQFELKTYEKTSRSITTHHTLNNKRIREYKKRLWIISEYDKNNNNQLTGEHYLLFPEDLETWFEKQEKRLYEGTEKAPGLGLKFFYELKNFALEKGFKKTDELQQLEDELNKAGINNPKISANKAIGWGTKLDTTRPDKSLREVLNKKTIDIERQDGYAYVSQ